MKYDVIIIGKGPAGISASLYTVRAGLSTLVIGNGLGSLEKATRIENYYGFPTAISGKELLLNGIKGAKRLGVDVISEEVVGISFEDQHTFKVTTNESDYRTSYVILATGAKRNAPNIKGVADFTGHGISYCAVCDSFFHKAKDVAVLGSGSYALNEAKELLHVVKSVTLLTNGEPQTAEFPPNVVINNSKIKAFQGTDNHLTSVLFESGETLPISGVFIAQGTASSGELALKLGVMMNGNDIAVNQQMETNVRNVYAAGDCTGQIYQIAKSVYQGMEASVNIIKNAKKN